MAADAYIPDLTKRLDMRALLQRSSGAEVWIDGKCHSRTKAGLVVLFGTKRGDVDQSCRWLAEKTANLRVFEDDEGKMNLSVLEVGGEVMVVSQFTLYADARKGRRPSYNEAGDPAEAERLYLRYVEELRALGLTVATGEFGARMEVKFTNHGPVTILLEHDI